MYTVVVISFGSSTKQYSYLLSSKTPSTSLSPRMGIVSGIGPYGKTVQPIRIVRTYQTGTLPSFITKQLTVVDKGLVCVSCVSQSEPATTLPAATKTLPWYLKGAVGTRMPLLYKKDLLEMDVPREIIVTFTAEEYHRYDINLRLKSEILSRHL